MYKSKVYFTGRSNQEKFQKSHFFPDFHEKLKNTIFWHFLGQRISKMAKMAKIGLKNGRQWQKIKFLMLQKIGHISFNRVVILENFLTKKFTFWTLFWTKNHIFQNWKFLKFFKICQKLTQNRPKSTKIPKNGQKNVIFLKIFEKKIFSFFLIFHRLYVKQNSKN